MTIAKTAGTVLIALGLLPAAAAAPAAPPSTGLTAAFAPASPTVGVTEVIISGRASAGAKVIDTSTFPDGSVHIFAVKADAAGAYTDGPFVLLQLGTYRDVLRDDATGASTTISYSGSGDFTIAVDPAAATITTAQGDFSIGVDPAHQRRGFGAALLQDTRVALIRIATVERGRDARLWTCRPQFVASDLFLNKAVVWLVGVE